MVRGAKSIQYSLSHLLKALGGFLVCLTLSHACSLGPSLEGFRIDVLSKLRVEMEMAFQEMTVI